MTVNNRFRGKLFHHHLTDLIGRTTPNIHHLVVAFALRYQTRGVLSFNFLDFFFSSCNQFCLLSRNRHIADADGQAANGGQSIATVLQTVSKKYRRTQTALAEAGVD